MASHCTPVVAVYKQLKVTFMRQSDITLLRPIIDAFGRSARTPSTLPPRAPANPFFGILLHYSRCIYK